VYVFKHTARCHTLVDNHVGMKVHMRWEFLLNCKGGLYTELDAADCLRSPDVFSQALGSTNNKHGRLMELFHHVFCMKLIIKKDTALTSTCRHFLGGYSTNSAISSHAHLFDVNCRCWLTVILKLAYFLCWWTRSVFIFYLWCYHLPFQKQS